MWLKLVVVNENVSLVISRQLLSDFCAHLPNLEDSVAKQVAHFTLDKVHTRVISFEEQVSYRFSLHFTKFLFTIWSSSLNNLYRCYPYIFKLAQVAAIRQHLADIYERQCMWREAANVLVGIPLETGQK